LWDRVKVLEKLRKINVPVAKSYVVYRGPRHELTQQEIETQAIGTKDKGEFYLQQAIEHPNDGMPLHRRKNSNQSDYTSPKNRDEEKAHQAKITLEIPQDILKPASNESPKNSDGVEETKEYSPSNDQLERKDSTKPSKKIKSHVLFEDIEADV